MTYQIAIVDGIAFADTISNFNKYVEAWPELQPKHYENGYWWLVFHGAEAIAFAGLVPFDPFPNAGYLKRCYVLPDHRGHSLQSRLIAIREAQGRSLGWTHLYSDSHKTNVHAANSFRRAGYALCEPEQPWEINSLYWVKEI
jgi:GNAT superfamily N-acetyltransferase